MSNCKNCGTPSAVTPYYKQVSEEVVQDHAAIFRDTQYAAGVVISDEFQVPAVNADIQVCVKDLVNLVIGSYLWNPRVGYLKIIYWSECKSKIGLLNEEGVTTAAPGSLIAACTSFIVMARPCCADQDNFELFPFLAADFEAPAVDASTTIKVTSTFGLVQGSVVRIGTCLYYLESINSSLEVVITNKGSGCTPGSTISAKDANGDLQYLITTQIISSCSSSLIDSGRLIICSGADEHILDGDFAGQVPVLLDPSSDEVAFELLDTNTRICTSLTTSVNLTPGIGTYIFPVEDASLFAPGDLLENQSSNLRFGITGVTLNNISVVSIPNPSGVTETLQIGEWICKILTTEFLQDEIDAIVTNLDTSYLRLNGANIASLAANIIPLTNLHTINTDRLLGRDTVGTGDVEELTVGGGLEFTGSGGIHIAPASVTSAMLDADAASRKTTILSTLATINEGTFIDASTAVLGLVTQVNTPMTSPGKGEFLRIMCDKVLNNPSSMKVWILKNGTQQAFLIMTYVDLAYKQGALSSVFSWVAGDVLGVTIDGTSIDWASATTSLVKVDLIGHYTG